jgi:hypothetical protein
LGKSLAEGVERHELDEQKSGDAHLIGGGGLIATLLVGAAVGGSSSKVIKVKESSSPATNHNPHSGQTDAEVGYPLPDRAVTNGAKGQVSPVIKVETSKVVKGTPEYDALNNLKANSRYELDNGSKFTTNSHGYVEDITFTPTLNKVPRDPRQTAVGKEGLSTDVGGHIQACSLGGTCDRYNLFPQDRNFNNSGRKGSE